MPYEAMKYRLTTWGRDEAAHQMVISFGYDMKRLPDHAYEALAPLQQTSALPASQVAHAHCR